MSIETPKDNPDQVKSSKKNALVVAVGTMAVGAVLGLMTLIGAEGNKDQAPRPTPIKTFTESATPDETATPETPAIVNPSGTVESTPYTRKRTPPASPEVSSTSPAS